MAWAAVSCVLPYFAGGYEREPVAYACWIIFLLSLVRTTLRDFLAIQGDRLVGKETLVVLAGEKRTVALHGRRTAGACPYSALRASGRGLHRFSYFLIVPALIYGFFLKMGSKRKLREDPLYEVLIEIVLIVTGLCAMTGTLHTELIAPPRSLSLTIDSESVLDQ